MDYSVEQEFRKVWANLRCKANCSSIGELAWSLTGNRGTTGSNFIGTTDAATLFFRQNNYNAGRIEGDATYNTAIGFAAFDGGTGILNSAFGVGALGSSPSGSNNTAMGISSLGSLTTGENNTALGSNAGVNISTGSHNTVIGGIATTFGNDSIYATVIGNDSRAASYSTALGANAHAQTEHTIVIGDATDITLYTGIGTDTPNAKLHIVGSLKIVDTTQGVGKILTSDADGLSSWSSLNVATYNLNSYADDAAADADAGLPSGGLYKLNTGRTVYQKP